MDASFLRVGDNDLDDDDELENFNVLVAFDVAFELLSTKTNGVRVNGRLRLDGIEGIDVNVWCGCDVTGEFFFYRYDEISIWNVSSNIVIFTTLIRILFSFDFYSSFFSYIDCIITNYTTFIEFEINLTAEKQIEIITHTLRDLKLLTVTIVLTFNEFFFTDRDRKWLFNY